MSTIFNTWVDRIQSGVFTKHQCLQWASAVAPLARGEKPGGKKTALDEHDATKLAALLSEHPVRLTASHEEQGIKWLLKYGRKVLALPEDAIERFDHFEYSGRSEPHNWRGGTPVWDIHTENGRVFHYFVRAWQSQSPGSDNMWWED